MTYLNTARLRLFWLILIAAVVMIFFVCRAVSARQPITKTDKEYIQEYINTTENVMRVDLCQTVPVLPSEPRPQAKTPQRLALEACLRNCQSKFYNSQELRQRCRRIRTIITGSLPAGNFGETKLMPYETQISKFECIAKCVRTHDQKTMLMRWSPESNLDLFPQQPRRPEPQHYPNSTWNPNRKPRS